MELDVPDQRSSPNQIAKDSFGPISPEKAPKKRDEDDEENDDVW